MKKPSIKIIKKNFLQTAFTLSLIPLLLISIAVFSGCGSSSNSSSVNSATASDTYGIWGTISGAVGRNVSVTLSGTGINTSTTTVIFPESLHPQGISVNSGFYNFYGLSNGSYTVTPSLAGYTFTPVSRSVIINSATIPDMDFTSTSITSSTHESIF